MPTILVPRKQRQKDQGYPWLHCKFKASLDLELCLKKQIRGYEDDPVGKVLVI